MVVTTAVAAPPVPKNADELAEMISDKARMKDVMSTPESF